MIATADIGCWQPPDFPFFIAASPCVAAGSGQAAATVRIVGKDNLVIAQFRVGHGNNNGNGNIGNNNGNGNSGSNNGNYNLGNNNGNCFTSYNNENNNQQTYNWDYRRLMQELQRCRAIPRYIP